jgi:hypothetical protein
MGRVVVEWRVVERRKRGGSEEYFAPHTKNNAQQRIKKRK